MKKLMGLLFEEEDDDIEETEEEVVEKPAHRSRTHKKAPEATYEEKPAKESVSFTAKPEPSVRTESRPAPTETLSIPVMNKEVAPEPIPEKKLGINVDELNDGVAKTRPVAGSGSVITPTVTKKTIVDSPKGGYEFTPVISPIFGVDEKDAAAVIPTNPKKAKVSDSKIGTIISPMYGMDKEAEPGMGKPMMSSAEEKSVEDIPNVSLDDLIAKGSLGDDVTTDFFSDEDLDHSEKKVVENRNISLFGDDDSNEQ